MAVPTLLPALHISGAGRRETLIDAITKAGATTNLRLCTDAGDINSYSGSGQDWIDVSSEPNADEIHLGTTAGASASDPTFVGTAGDLSSYFSFDGGDTFAYGAGQETWMVTMHRNGAAWSAVFGIYFAATTSEVFFKGFLDSNTGGGMQLAIASGNFDVTVSNAGNSGQALVVTGDSTISAGAWHFLGVSIDESAGAGGGFLYVDGDYDQVSGSDTFDATYSSPTVTNPNGFGWFGRYDGGQVMSNGGRGMFGAMWNGTALSKAQMDAIFARVRGRLGI